MSSGTRSSGALPTLPHWFRSLRPYSFTASIMPVALAAVWAAYTTVPGGESETMLHWWPLVVFLPATVLFHAGTNVLNDYYDHLHRVDGEDDRDPTHTISAGLVTPRFMLISGNIYFLAGVLAGLPIAMLRGPWYLVAGLAGALGGYLYTSKRFSLKYVALGDLAVFLLMGPALVAMGVWALTGSTTGEVVPVSLPIALLVTAILHGNNLRDIEGDRQAGITTVAGLLGRSRAQRLLEVLVLGTYAVTIALILVGLVPATVVATLATIPVAVKILRSVSRTEEARLPVALPVMCAQLHLLFSLLYVAGIGGGALWR